MGRPLDLMEFHLNNGQTSAVRIRHGLGGDTVGLPKSARMYKGCTRDVQGMYKGTTSSQHHRNPIATPGHRARAKARTKGPLQIFCWLQNARRQGSARASCNDFASRSIPRVNANTP